MSTAWKATTSTVSNAWNATTSAVSSAYNFVSEKVSRGIDLVGNGIKNVKDWTVKQVKTKVQQVKNTYNQVKQQAKNVINKVQAVAKPYIEAAKKVVEAHVEAVKDAFKATVNWIEEHKAEIAGFVVGAIVGIGCGALIGWTGVGAVACGALAGAAGSLVTGAMKGHTGWELVGDALIGGTIGALTGGLGSALSAGIGSGIRGLAGGLGNGLKAFGSAFKAEGANILSGLAGAGRSALGSLTSGASNLASKAASAFTPKTIVHALGGDEAAAGGANSGLRAFADTLRAGYNKVTGPFFAAQYRSAAGNVYQAPSRHGLTPTPGGALEQALQATGHHGNCAEVGCLIMAEQAGDSIIGGFMNVMRVRGLNSTGGAHGTSATPCPDSCNPLLRLLGIGS